MGYRRASAAALVLVIPLLAASIVAEDPLPVVHLRSDQPAADRLMPLSTVSFDAPSIVLASYPIRNEFTEPVVEVASVPTALDALRSAAAANDLRLFQATLARAKQLVDAMPLGAKRNDARRALLVYRDVQQVWNFAANDRLGAFYDDESLPGFHERIAADYPTYDAFIADYRVVDRYGRALYGTSETRMFLLKQLLPTQAPRPQTLIARKATRRAHIARAHVGRAKVGRASARSHAIPSRAKARPALAPKPADALVADMRNAAVPERIAPQPDAVPASDNGGHGLVFIVLALLGLGILTMFVRTARVA